MKLKSFCAALLLFAFACCPSSVYAECPLPKVKLWRDVKEVTLSISGTFRHFREEYDEYPKALEPEFLKTVFGERVKKTVLPYVTPDENCQIPNLSVFDDRPPNYFLNTDGIVNIFVRVEVQGKKKKESKAFPWLNAGKTWPPFVILSYQITQVTPNIKRYAEPDLKQLIIPLDMRAENIEEKVRDFANSLGKEQRERAYMVVDSFRTAEQEKEFQEKLMQKTAAPKMIPLPLPIEDGAE